MPAETVQSKKNYIGIVNDSVEEQRTAAPRTKSEQVVRNLFAAVMTAVMKRQSETKS
jgi:hypothetical protein